MAKLQLVAGTTSYIAQIFIQSSTATDGSGLTGLLNNSSGLTAYYHRDTDTTATAISLVTMTVGTFTSSGFKEIDSTNMPGWYQFCPPNAALAAGAKSVGIHLKGATNMAPLPLEIELTATNNQDAVRGGMTALPNANAEAAGGLYTRGTGAGQIKQTNNGEIDSNTTHINNVATTSVTTVNANIGVTQPINFTGTAASALVKSDMVDVAGSAVSTSSAQLGVNVVQMNAVSAASVTTINANQGTTQPVNFTGTAASALVKGDTVDWNGTAVATPATAGIPEVNVKNMNNVSAAAITTIKAVQGLTTADTIVTVSGNVNGSVGSVTGAVGSVTGNVGGNVVGSVASVTGAVGSVTGNVGGNVVGSVASVTAAVAITSNVKKNQALNNFEFLMTDSTNHNPATGKVVTVTRSIDGSAFAAGTLSAVTEISNGIYSVNFGAGDLNGNVVTLRATAASCDDTFERIETQP